MKAHGMLFSAPMIRALLNTKPDVWPAKPINESLPYKWQTRRLHHTPGPHPVGTLIYAKETFQPRQLASVVTEWNYRATDKQSLAPWKPSIFMPKAAARLWFQVVAVRVERVNDIYPGDCLAEGIAIPEAVQRASALNFGGGEFDTIDWDPTEDYERLWDSINGKGSFARGPFVWVYELRRLGANTL